MAHREEQTQHLEPLAWESSILAVAINTHNFRVKSWPEGHRPERSNVDEEEPEGSNSAQQHQEEAGVSDSAQGVNQLAPTVCTSSSSLGHSCPHSLGGCKARTEMEPVKASRVWQKDKTLSWQLTILRLMGMQDPAVHWPRQQPCATPSPQSFSLAAGLAGTPMASPPGGHCDKGGLNTLLLAAIEQEPIPATGATVLLLEEGRGKPNTEVSWMTGTDPRYRMMTTDPPKDSDGLLS